MPITTTGRPSTKMTGRLLTSVMRSRSALGAYLRRQRSRLGAPKAITATAHKLARIVYGLVRYGWAYVKATEEEYAQQVKERLVKNLHRRAKELGYQVIAMTTPEPVLVTASPGDCSP